MIGGFLGAGKTTAVAQLAGTLRKEGRRVGLITNDQGSQLVDTAMLSSRGFAVEEIPGGCFCCRFNSLMEAARKLSAETAPDVFIAEPVGSCTDLVATVTYPLRRIYGERFSISPLSVLIDPVRALRIFGHDESGSFSEKVVYIYEKQLQEADLIVINKTDLVGPGDLENLRKELVSRFPSKPVLEVSARNGTGLESWFSRIISTEQEVGPAMNIDYQVYGEGEALLGWLNATLRITSPTEFDGNELLKGLARALQNLLRAKSHEIAHLKMTLSPDDAFSDVAVINLVRTDGVPEISQELPEPIETGELIVNLRAEADPEELRIALTKAVDELNRAFAPVKVEIEHVDSFRPGQPNPTHRITDFAAPSGDR